MSAVSIVLLVGVTTHVLWSSGGCKNISAVCSPCLMVQAPSLTLCVTLESISPFCLPYSNLHIRLKMLFGVSENCCRTSVYFDLSVFKFYVCRPNHPFNYENCKNQKFLGKTCFARDFIF